MKTKIILLSLLLLCAHNAFSCFTVDRDTINAPSGIITCIGDDYKINKHKEWLINIGESKKIRLKIYADIKPNTDSLIIYEANGGNLHLIKEIKGGFYREEIITTGTSGQCEIQFNPSGGGGTSYPGIHIEFSAAPDENTQVTESSSKILGGQFVMGKLGIGTDVPATALHIYESNPYGSSLPLTRYQGTAMSTSGSKAVSVDEFLLQEGSSPGHIQGVSINNTPTTPQDLTTWVKQLPQSKSISLGSGTQTLLEAKALATTGDSLSQGEVSIGKSVEKAGYGIRLSFGGVNTSYPLYLARYYYSSDRSDIRMNLGNGPSNDGMRFVIGSTTVGGNGRWYPKFTFTASGKLGVGKDNPQYPIDVTGIINADTIKAKVLKVENSFSANKVSQLTINNDSTIIASPATFHVYNGSELNSFDKNFMLISTFEGNLKGTNDRFRNSIWIRRQGNGEGTSNARFHDGLSIGNNTYPCVNTQSWWERGEEGLQVWGNRDTVQMVLKDGKLGIGGITPTQALEVNGTIRATRIEATTISTGISGNDSTLYISTDGKIGINTTMPSSPFHIYSKAALGSSSSNYQPIVTFQGNPQGASTFKNTLWLKRDENSGNSWTTARLHDGISIGNEVIPRTNTSTYWERDPKDTLQIWGHKQDYYMVLKGRKLGIGIAEPAEMLHVNGNIKADTVRARALYIYENLVVGTNINDYRRLFGYSNLTGNDGPMAYVYHDLIRYKAENTHNLSTKIRDAVYVNTGGLNTIPGVNSLTWWDRKGYDGIQSWGHKGTTYMTLKGGRLGIGVDDPQHALVVNGIIQAKKVMITETVGADFVFAPDYKLLKLDEVENHINEHQHLPEIPSAAEMKEKGVDMIELNIKLLQKIEELTLYVIEQNKQLSNQGERIKSLEKVLDEK